MESAEKSARRALNRLRRRVEQARREVRALEGALERAEGEDFPRDAYGDLRDRISEVLAFVEEEARRLEEKILESGGLEAGRVRRSSE